MSWKDLEKLISIMQYDVVSQAFQIARADIAHLRTVLKKIMAHAKCSKLSRSAYWFDITGPIRDILTFCFG